MGYSLCTGSGHRLGGSLKGIYTILSHLPSGCVQVFPATCAHHHHGLQIAPSPIAPPHTDALNHLRSEQGLLKPHGRSRHAVKASRHGRGRQHPPKPSRDEAGRGAGACDSPSCLGLRARELLEWPWPLPTRQTQPAARVRSRAGRLARSPRIHAESLPCGTAPLSPRDRALNDVSNGPEGVTVSRNDAISKIVIFFFSFFFVDRFVHFTLRPPDQLLRHLKKLAYVTHNIKMPWRLKHAWSHSLD